MTTYEQPKLVGSLYGCGYATCMVVARQPVWLWLGSTLFNSGQQAHQQSYATAAGAPGVGWVYEISGVLHARDAWRSLM